MDAETEVQATDQTTPPVEDQVSTAPPEQEAETTGTPVETQETEKEGEEQAPKKDGVQKRIDEITREKYDAIRDAAYWKGVAEARRAQEAPKEEAKPEPPVYEAPPFAKPRPTLEAFEYDEAKLRQAELEWIGEKATHDAYHKAKAELEDANRRRDAEARLASYSDWVQQGTGKYADFQEVVQNSINMAPNGQIPEVMREAVREADNSHEVAYYLGKNPQEFQRIASLPPFKQAKEVFNISFKLATKTVQPKTITNAAPPIAPVKPQVAPTVSLSDMNTEDYMAYMDEQEFGKRGG